jgi:hypothetical protein
MPDFSTSLGVETRPTSAPLEASFDGRRRTYLNTFQFHFDCRLRVIRRAFANKSISKLHFTRRSTNMLPNEKKIL